MNASSPSTTQIQTVLRFLCVLQFNFVGKLLGPRGNSLKRLQEDTLTKMSILGKGSMRDKEKVKPHSFAGFICLLSLLVSLLLLLVIPPPAAAHPSLGWTHLRSSPRNLVELSETSWLVVTMGRRERRALFIQGKTKLD